VRNKRHLGVLLLSYPIGPTHPGGARRRGAPGAAGNWSHIETIPSETALALDRRFSQTAQTCRFRSCVTNAPANLSHLPQPPLRPVTAHPSKLRQSPRAPGPRSLATSQRSAGSSPIGQFVTIPTSRTDRGPEFRPRPLESCPSNASAGHATSPQKQPWAEALLGCDRQRSPVALVDERIVP